jgi:hypothetical protein
MIKAWKIALMPEDVDRPMMVAYLEAGVTKSLFNIPDSLS